MECRRGVRNDSKKFVAAEKGNEKYCSEAFVDRYVKFRQSFNTNKLVSTFCKKKNLSRSRKN